jgi:hypothetical protein
LLLNGDKDMRKGNVQEWLTGAKEFGKLSSSDNFYFEGDCIYSYGRHFTIAKIVDRENKVILFTTETFSHTTARHCSEASWALRGKDKKLIFVPCPSATPRHNIERLKEQIAAAEAIKGRGRAQEYREEQIKNLKLHLSDYMKFLKGKGYTIKSILKETKPRKVYFQTITRERVKDLGACGQGRDTLDFFLRKMKKDEVTLEELFKSVSEETFDKFSAFGRWLLSYFATPEHLNAQIRKEFDLIPFKDCKKPILSRISYRSARTQYNKHGYMLDNIYDLVVGNTTLKEIINVSEEKEKLRLQG